VDTSSLVGRRQGVRGFGVRGNPSDSFGVATQLPSGVAGRRLGPAESQTFRVESRRDAAIGLFSRAPQDGRESRP